MKKTITILSALLVFLSFSSFVSITPENCSVIIKKGKIKVQGVTITPDYELSLFKAALGDADRERDGYNKTHTYDKLSIVLFEPMVDKKPSGKISEFQLHYSVPESNSVTPNGDGFKGTFKVDKLTITKDLSVTKMLAGLKGWKKTDSYMEHSYRMAKGAIYIYFQFNDTETSMVKASIGINKDKK